MTTKVFPLLGTAKNDEKPGNKVGVSVKTLVMNNNQS